MKQEEFKLLVANVTAIANQTFTIQCGEFATSLADEEKNDLSTEAFSQQKHLDEFDFQSVIDSGYQQLDELAEEIDSAWCLLDTETLEASLKNLPTEFATLHNKMTGDDLKTWISHALEAEDESPFYNVHQYIMQLFRGNMDIDDDTYDLIREAVAFNEIDELQAKEDEISSEHIQFDDLVTAATIQSFKTFDWLFKRAELDDNQIINLLESFFDDQSAFEQVFNIIKPTAQQYSGILASAQANNNSSIIDFLNSNSTR